MSAPRFFEAQTMKQGDVLELSERNANHIARVLRLRAGAKVVLFNGEGGEFAGMLARVERRRAQIEIQSYTAVDRVSSLHTHLGQVISRGHRMEYAIQKATELGVTEITPLFSERCEVRLEGDRLEKRGEHWRQVAISACEQCGRNRLPEIHLPKGLMEWLREVRAEEKWILDTEAEAGFGRGPAPASLALAVGPEGGLSAAELQQAQAHAFQGLRLGPRVLRTESAPVVALSIAQHLWGDLAD